MNVNGSFQKFRKDAVSGLVVFLVAVPLCLGIAIASGAPPFSGLISGIVGGIVAGLFSRSHTSVSGPAAALASVVVSQIAFLGSYEMFLAAVMVAGIIQIFLGLLQLGAVANYIPSSVVKGLLVSIGIILVSKQLPHLLGFDLETKVAFSTHLIDGDLLEHFKYSMSHFQIGSLLVGLISIGIIIGWERSAFLKKTKVPAPLAVIILGTGISILMGFSPTFLLNHDHLVNVPVNNSFMDFINNFNHPDFGHFFDVKVWTAGFTIAMSASLASLLNIEAVDKLDRHSRNTPKNWELVAQGFGNITSGLIGGIPITSEVVRGSINVQYGAETKRSTIMHGVLLLLFVGFLPMVLNFIPLSTLAAVLVFTGYKLAKPSVFISTYKNGLGHFIPFVITVISILSLGLLVGICVGIAAGLIVVVRNDMMSALKVISEKHYNEDVERIILPQVTSFINKAKIREILNGVPPNSKVIIDASISKYIDGDILEVINNFKHIMAPNKKITLSMVGFKNKYGLNDEIKHAHVVTKELQSKLTPDEVVNILKEGNKRFLTGSKIEKNIANQMNITSTDGQHPLAVVLSCIDSRTTTEIIFDLGMGDVFSVRLAGNVVNQDILASMEFACKIAGAKLIVVLGHTECGAIKGACDNLQMGNLDKLFSKIKPAIDAEYATQHNRNSSNALFVKNVTRLNVHHNIFHIAENSEILSDMINNGEVGIIGGVYDIKTGEVKFTPMYQSRPISVQ